MAGDDSSRQVAGATGGATVRIGDIVGAKYMLDALIGEGGIAVVYRAKHLDLEEFVALKFLRAEGETPDVRNRFTKEGRAAVRLKSEYVCRVTDVGTHDGAPYMVMEYLEGQDLNETLNKRGALPVAEAVEYII